ncbi:MAG: membrane protein insertion efficiency factor YidD [Oscillospiraceae bacterium]
MIRKIPILLIRFYQKTISPIIGPRCKYYPTCSNYSIEAFKKHGFFKGMILSIWRLLRCNPFSKGGIDYVPDEFSILKRRK